ncbi:MAG: coenzyme hydrogenase/dehydrogenase beta subunit domain protein [Bacteroidetes bacterium]|nr:coenzyme hydrogenase/dehydrogenase beta subunit domain protein [Bacteroidota bacterium]
MKAKTTIKIKNISSVAKSNICTGCGLCASICPENCISMVMDKKKGVYQSQIDINKCTNCSVCIKTCPPITWSNKPTTSNADIRLGDYIEFKALFSNNEIIRKESASGGFITSLLVYLLNNQIIDGAIISKRNPDNPLIGIPFIATTVEEITENSTSIYGPVKFDEIIKHLLSTNDPTKKYVLVGLPCHIEGISRAQRLYKILTKNIYLKIGIVCGQSPSIFAYDYSFKKLKVDKSNITSFKNRGGGWPGFMQIGVNNKDIKYPYPGKYSMGMVLGNPLFTPTACQKCVDAVGYNADLTASDAWLSKFENDKIGRSFVMIKTSLGKEIVENAILNQIFTSEEINRTDFIKANIGVINKAYKGKINSILLKTKSYKNTYHTEMIFPENVGLKRLILLYIYSINIFPIQFIGANKLSKIANDTILFYFKFINLLKKKSIHLGYYNSSYQTLIKDKISQIEIESNNCKKNIF